MPVVDLMQPILQICNITLACSDVSPVGGNCLAKNGEATKDIALRLITVKDIIHTCTWRISLMILELL